MIGLIGQWQHGFGAGSPMALLSWCHAESTITTEERVAARSKLVRRQDRLVFEITCYSTGHGPKKKVSMVPVG
jgi:hypothetical protein